MATMKGGARSDEARMGACRGWALEFGLMCAAHLAEDAALAGIGHQTVQRVLADQG